MFLAAIAEANILVPIHMLSLCNSFQDPDFQISCTDLS